MFWRHSIQHSSKTQGEITMTDFKCFGGIQFNTALKLVSDGNGGYRSFGGIQFNTALKLRR